MCAPSSRPILSQAGDSRPSEKPAPTKPAPAKPRVIPDPNWVPKPGDRAEVIVEDAPACKHRFAYDEYMKSSQAKDRVGIEKALAGGAITKLPRGVGVLVLQVSRPQRVATAPAVQSTESFLDSLQAAASAPRDETVYPLEVRIQAGPLKDAVMYVPEDCVARMIPAPPARSPANRRAKAKPKLKTFQGGTPANRASRAYRDARNLEDAGKLPEAIAAYQELSKSIFPEAKLAKARLKALTGK